MRKEYEQELINLKAKMQKAEKFAEELPIFKDIILENKFTSEEGHINFGNRCKELYLDWGINRNRLISGTNRTITNYDRDATYNKHLFSIYFNTLTIYDSHNKYDLDKITEKVDVFFYDSLNSTFYIEDEHIERFLDEAVRWLEIARKKEKELRDKKRIESLQKELKELETN